MPQDLCQDLMEIFICEIKGNWTNALGIVGRGGICVVEILGGRLEHALREMDGLGEVNVW